MNESKKPLHFSFAISKEIWHRNKLLLFCKNPKVYCNKRCCSKKNTTIPCYDINQLVINSFIHYRTSTRPIWLERAPTLKPNIFFDLHQNLGILINSSTRSVLLFSFVSHPPGETSPIHSYKRAQQNKIDINSYRVD
jgi:hypothetical protein